MNWLEPWYGLSEKEKEIFTRRLKKEITSNHILAGLSFKLFGKNNSSDDVLIEIEEGEFKLAVVHLVWNKSTNHEYPLSYFYKDWQDFVDNRMKKDNFEYEQ